MGRAIAVFLATVLALRLMRNLLTGMKKNNPKKQRNKDPKPWNENKVEEGKYEDI